MIGRLLKLSIIVAVAAVAVGIWLGSTRATFGPAPLKTVDGTARLGDADTGLALAESEDGDHQFVFNVHAIAWTSGSEAGDGDPPCLRTPGKKAEVVIGYRSIRLPDGRTVENVPLWIRC